MEKSNDKNVGRLKVFWQEASKRIISHDLNLEPIHDSPTGIAVIYWVLILLQHLSLVKFHSHSPLFFMRLRAGIVDQVGNRILYLGNAEMSDSTSNSIVLGLLCYLIAKLLIFSGLLIMSSLFPDTRKQYRLPLQSISMLNLLDWTFLYLIECKVNATGLARGSMGIQFASCINIILMSLQGLLSSVLSFTYQFSKSDIIRDRGGMFIPVRIMGVLIISVLWALESQNKVETSLTLAANWSNFAFNLILLGIHYFSYNFVANPAIDRTIIFCLSFSMSYSLLASLECSEVFTRKPQDLDLYILVASPLFAAIIARLRDRSTHYMTCVKSADAKRSSSEWLSYLYLFNQRYQNRSSLHHYWKLTSQLSCHLATCTKPHCLCFVMRLAIPQNMRKGKALELYLDTEASEVRQGSDYALGVSDETFIGDCVKSDRKRFLHKLEAYLKVEDPTLVDKKAKNKTKSQLTEIANLDSNISFCLLMYSLFNDAISSNKSSHDSNPRLHFGV
jgi:hypothetical protein